ncbi:MAG TPA: hypothetical protein VNV39_18395 [Stellaceae bacterium]|jgi:hypothetical protein|nr:hypothetical protein [Stellaceae bacterium]
MDNKTRMFTFPVTDPERKALKLAATKNGTTMADLIRRGVTEVLSEVSPEDAEIWQAMAVHRNRVAA